MSKKLLTGAIADSTYPKQRNKVCNTCKAENAFISGVVVSIGTARYPPPFIKSVSLGRGSDGRFQEYSSSIFCS